MKRNLCTFAIFFSLFSLTMGEQASLNSPKEKPSIPDQNKKTVKEENKLIIKKENIKNRGENVTQFLIHEENLQIQDENSNVSNENTEVSIDSDTD